jgi:hypothetical protein
MSHRAENSGLHCPNLRAHGSGTFTLRSLGSHRRLHSLGYRLPLFWSTLALMETLRRGERRARDFR